MLALVAGNGPLAGTAAAGSVDVDPSTLGRGENPTVAYLVRDTIRDGDLRVPATTRGHHEELWTVAGGYLLDDQVGPRDVHRLVYVARSGAKRTIARHRWPTGTVVSPDGRWISWGEALGRDPGPAPPALVTVARPRSGRVVASRRFHWATVLAVSGHRVLLTRMGRNERWTTWWWNFRRDTMSRLSPDLGVRASLAHRRLVLGVGEQDAFSYRVAPLDRPRRTLWNAPLNSPRSWSPDGTRTLATHNYLDDTGTTRWDVRTDRTGQRLLRVTGRLDWTAVWEDDSHFLVIAQGDDGAAAVVRCSVGGDCERASRVWALEVPDYLPNYIAPPVLLALR